MFEELLLSAPVHMIASVGFVKEDGLNILPIKIGEIEGNKDVYDLAVIYCKTSVSLHSFALVPVSHFIHSCLVFEVCCNHEFLDCIQRRFDYLCCCFRTLQK